MILPYPTDPSLPGNPSPVFSDTTAARGDHLRANNAEIWANFVALTATKNIYTSSPVTLPGNLQMQSAIFNSASAIVANLPAATGSGISYQFTNINTGLVSITPNGSDVINGFNTAWIVRAWDSFGLIDIAAGVWIINGDYSPSNSPIGTIIDWAGATSALPSSAWAIADGSAISRTTYATLWPTLSVVNSTLFTTSLSSNTVFTIASGTHPYQTGDCIAVVSTTGTFPTGILAETNLYVIYQSTTTFKVASTYANAIAGTAIGATAGSGNFTIRWNPWGIAAPATFNLPDLRGISTMGDGQQGYATWWGTLSNYTGRLGQYLQDRFQGFTLGDGSFGNTYKLSGSGTVGNAPSGSGSTGYAMVALRTDGAALLSILADASHGTPRVDNVTRGPVVAVKKIIRVS